MFGVVISYNEKDGDHLTVTKLPIWTPVWDLLVMNRLCPCCGLSGFLSRWDWWGATAIHKAWSWAVNVIEHRRVDLYKVPIPSACEAFDAIFGPKYTFCWRDDCPVHPEEEPKSTP